MYIQHVFSRNDINDINDLDQDILQHLCVPLTDNDIAKAEQEVNATAASTSANAIATPPTTSAITLAVDDNDEDQDQDSHQEDEDTGKNKQRAFLQSVMCCLYSKNRPADGTSASNFIIRLEECHLLSSSDVHPRGYPRQLTQYTPANMVRAISSQMSVELKNHFKKGSCELHIKLKKMVNKGQLPLESDVKLRKDISSIENFVRLNAIAKGARTPIPLSQVKHGFVTFS
ncbi:hypothetical protein BGZ80_007807, partial [Entomortierella chlamydospora]